MKPNTESLARVGPSHPVHAFPLWYADGSGLRLELGLDRSDPRLPAIGEPPVVPPPPPFDPDFPDEAFYFYAEAEMTVNGTAGPARARLILALEAAFGGTGEIAPGQQIVFGRIRVRCDELSPDTAYVVEHPYGVTAEIRSDDRGRLRWTQDLGGGPGDFAAALDGQVAPFLTSVSPPQGGYLGDGMTATRVTGSPFGTNLFRLHGPRVGNTGSATGGPDVNVIETDLFAVQGRKTRVTGVRVDRIGYRRDAAGAVTLDVQASTAPDSRIEVSGVGVPTTVLTGTGTGHYAGRIACSQVPFVADVRAVGSAPVPPDLPVPADPPQLRLRPAISDLVLVTRADHDPTQNTLTVDAASTDLVVPSTLTVHGDGVPDTEWAGGTVVVGGVNAAPPEIVVDSSRGGTARYAVLLTGSVTAPLPVTAAVAPVPLVPPGRRVVLDGRASVGARAFAWQQLSGNPVALTAPASDVTTFVAPAAGRLTFRLTVTDATGSVAAAVTTVDVSVAVPTRAQAGPDLTAAVGTRVALDGSASASAVTFAWAQTGGLAVNLADAGSARPSFRMPAEGPVTLRLTTTGPVGPPSSDEVTVVPMTDRLVVNVAQYRTGSLAWRIGGTADGPAPDRVTARLDGVEIGSALVDATRVWEIRRTVLGAGDPLRPPVTGARIDITTSRGGTATVPVIVRN